MTEREGRPDLRALLQAKKPALGTTRLIAVDGRGGSGKTTLARLLARELAAEVIHTDDFASWERPLDWYTDVIAKVLVPIRNGARSLSYRPTRWWDNHHPEPVTAQPVTEVMILEGVSALRREFREYLTLGIFVETPSDVCLRRGVERDLATGKPLAEIERLWAEWADGEERYFAEHDPRGQADILLDGRRPFSDQIRL